ncbi:hypothetical protein NEOLEDRAFT_1073172 [Neolentinus lepideus HHB14362 ss-1]|uniref:LYR motif-containing protein 2 n=1 Tax=Neolentinus lepideus HHB14362 ss-1 TaxID=1314782 RepID=A0A165PXP0_9AGAM|nr:hypothetical protein NEOLEDRAFT_1073172 [Neolentinus lepideus HHB14362 ss-1]
MQDLTLKHFILRHRVLGLYRQAVRSSKSIPHPQARKETVLWIRSEFERNRYLHDADVIEDRLASGRRELKRILPSIQLPASGSL